ncbi:hypothetical protein AB0E12_13385 [Micromonospora chersina]|uniref:hypothetical protein n=1 Tax=Micromonospora chersina TaxID=47854 RepID=UPI00340397B3
MLAPDTRSLLLDALRPPPGMRMSRAVALTFTLDLESLLVAPLAFAAYGLRESTDPIAGMDGVRHCADRTDAFCQSGQIVVPWTQSALLVLVEPIVRQVHRSMPSRCRRQARALGVNGGHRRLRLRRADAGFPGRTLIR